jgi:hypothetical protein
LPEVPVDAGALEDADAAADALAAGALLDAPVDAPAAAGAELDDEHAAVTPSSNAAVAPAAGTDKDRFILLLRLNYESMVRQHVTDVKNSVLIPYPWRTGILVA